MLLSRTGPREPQTEGAWDPGKLLWEEDVTGGEQERGRQDGGAAVSGTRF